MLLSWPALGSDPIDVIARVKQSVVAVGTFERERSPAFDFRGTGFAIGEGKTIVTNAHVLPGTLDIAHNEALVILHPSTADGRARIQSVTQIASDPTSDLALLRFDGEPMRPLTLHDSDSVREGQAILFTGFPLGGVLGPFAATHRGIVSAITPIAIPQGNAETLNPALVHRLARGSFPVFQLDATAYPGNSGSPIYDPATGEVFGIVNMVLVKGVKESALTHPSGITYGVPSRHIRDLLKDSARDRARG